VVTTNALFDRFFANHRKTMTGDAATAEYVAGDDATYTIAQRDLVFRLKPTANALIGRSDASGILDMKLKVFSNLNNFPVRLLLSNNKNAKDDAVSRMMAVRSAVAFVGVALQPVDYTNKNSKDMVAVQVAGSITIVNTGPYTIRPGMKICWDVPAVIMGHNKRFTLKRPRSVFRGQPNTKDMFQTIPLDEVVANSVEGVVESQVQKDTDIIRQLHIAHPHVGAPPPGANTGPSNKVADILRDAYDDMVAHPNDAEKAILYGRLLAAYVCEANNRVIGIALSGASPGQQFGASIACFPIFTLIDLARFFKDILLQAS
jgi:hypothetical protein